MSDFDQVQGLWDAAAARFGRIDIWINNAANNTPVQKFMWEHSADVLESVIQTNMLGVIYGSKVAIAGMIAQGSGFLYNMEGFGSGGEVSAKNAMYGTSKAGLRYLTRVLIMETKHTPVKVCYLSPGMVTTDLLVQTIAPGRETQAERIFNILADRVETVTPWLVERIMANEKAGARIAWLTQPKIIMRFMSAPFRKRNVVGDLIRSKA